MKPLAALLLVLLSSANLEAQDSQHLTIKNLGIPPIQNYGVADHHFNNINFNVIAGDDGRMYFGNYKGILVFDGVNWTNLSLPNEGAVYGLTKSSNGTIYVGGINEIGYLKSLDNGELGYVSLLDSIGGPGEGFTSRAYALENQIIFAMSKQTVILSLSGEKTTILKNPEGTTTFQQCRNELYAFTNTDVFILKKGEWKWKGDNTLVDVSSRYDGKLVDTPDRILAVTREGFYDFEKEQKVDADDNVEKFLKKSRITSVDLIADQYLAIGTFAGLLITDLNGKPLQLLNKERGLADDFVFRTFLDQSGLLWVATYNGISKIDIFSPITIYDSRQGIKGVLKDIQLIDDQVYLCTMSGVFRGKWKEINDPFAKASFEKISSVTAHGMITSEEASFIYTEREHNQIIENGQVRDIPDTRQHIYWSGLKFKNSDDVLLGSYEGDMIHLTRASGQWKIKKKFDPIFLATECMAEGSGNNIWVSSINEGIFRIKFDKIKSEIIDQKKYGEINGLPSDLNNIVFDGYKEPLFATNKGIYVHDPTNDRFIKAPSISEWVKNPPVFLIAQRDKDYVHYYTDEYRSIKTTEGAFELIEYPQIDFINFPPERITILDDKNVLLSSAEAVLHIDPNQYQPKNEFKTNITSIANLATDSIIFGGFGAVPANIFLDSENESIRISFAATSFLNSSKNRYKWRLKGFEDDWSSWSNETWKDYTKLPHGNFTFQVIGKNAFGMESEPVSTRFTIATPWYYSTIVYAIYFCGLGLVLWIVIVLYTRKLRADRTRLELIVEDRTKEISEQRNKLLQMDDLKKRFFVNISHELRTPLTLSMGTVDQALKGNYGTLNDELYANLQVSKRNSERLLKMVTSILDISKLEGGKIQLYAAPVDSAKIVRKVLAFFSSRLSDKHITLEETLIDDTELFLDEDKFETILINLISNAFKFTPDGGLISFSMKDMPDQVIFTISDSGEGIPEEDIKLVFDRFYQSPTIKSGEGMGVGLALTRELVELHHGTVEAKNDHGAVFILCFPKGKNHLSPNQIIEPDESSISTNLADKYPLYDDRDITIIPQKETDTQLEHILLVEDNTEMRQFISSILSPYYQVSWADDGSKGLTFLKETKPDLIITDYLMPNMNGYEMAVEIKKQEEMAFIPIVFLTARTREQDKINVLNLGVDDYLFKPFSADELLVRIKNLLFNKKHRVEYIEEQEIDSSDIEWKEFGSKIKADMDQYIMDHIKDEITGDQLATQTGHSERSLYRKVKANTGLSLMQYVREFRLRQARNLLENKEFHTVSEVSYAVGFNYLSHFTKNYKERFGKQPSEYLD
jgi:signal transduction histidine kinase/DNA-binding response OmpR family regulator